MDLEKRMLADERKFSRQDQEQMPLVISFQDCQVG